MPKNRKPVKKNTKTNRSNARQHPKHFLKVYWPYIPLIAVVVSGMLFGGVRPSSRVNQPATLAYSTEMGIANLLSSTNEQRASNGLGPLTINSTLNSSAQSKANDMIARDYWAHNTPDGQEPWVFFDAAGYNYQKAGENLAYGFSTSNDTVIGWMNSPSHRANVLDDTFSEVGFGFANSDNFTGTGNETVVVAHYALPVEGTAAPAVKEEPVVSTPASKPPQALNANTSSVPEEEVLVPIEEEIVVEEPVLNKLSEDRINQPITTENESSGEAESKNITRLQSLTAGKAPWSALALSVVGFIIVIAWVLKHAYTVKKYLLKGEQFATHHPLVDLFVVLVVAIAVYLSQSSGVVL